VAAHDHSGAAVIARLVAAVAEGKSVAYASEAGTPLISDPGFTLVRAMRAAGLPVTAAPGASAVLAALTVAGLPAERFLFLGFLPQQPGPRRAAIAEVVREKFSIVLYESPHRISETMQDLAQGLGGARPAVLCRELTKRFEEVRAGTLASLADDPALEGLRGEMVIVIGPPGAEATETVDVEAALAQAMQGMRIKDAVTAVAGALGLPRREVYQIALAMKGDVP
jgi:16S rRNA (cytidine1402-2'-O)-methyltransferase